MYYALVHNRVPVVHHLRVENPGDVAIEHVEVTLELTGPDGPLAEPWTRAATMNAVYGAEDRVQTLTEDLVAHWEKRRELMRPHIGGPGKAMVVCATREHLRAAVRRSGRAAP
ncbi:hypothetical protein [Saccharopolyspora shandongensis]|uniref:hypothetical protein n=1 Tax=Saccharopolyspora shandongensis TaxID=418495 RepID=UPI003411D1A6